MENYQDNIKEIIYQKCHIIYKKCLKLTLHPDDFLVVDFNKELANNMINDEFINNISLEIEKCLNLNNNNDIKKILHFHFNNIMIGKISGRYKIKKNNNINNIEDIFNPIKYQVLKEFYHHLDLTRLENNIFNFLNFNDFIFYFIRNYIKFLQPLGYLIIIVFIIYLVDNN